MKELTTLGKKYNTDKHDENHTHRGLSYLDVFQLFFEQFKNKPINLLEIGVREGRSLRVWYDYFPNAKIYGLDILPKCKQYENIGSRVKIFTGDQNNKNVLQEIVDDAGNFDIVIDDGSHINDHMVASCNFLLPHVNKNGIYIIEDLVNSYRDVTEDVKLWPGHELNTGLNTNNKETRPNLNNMLLELIKNLDLQQTELLTVQFWSQLIILVK